MLFGIKWWLLWQVWIRFFVFLIQFSFEGKNCWISRNCDHRSSFCCLIEIVTEKWSVNKASKKCASVITSWRLFEIKKQSNLLCIKPEACFCFKINCIASGFISLQVLHRLKCYFILITFPTDLFFKQGELPSAKKVILRKRLKPPAKVLFIYFGEYLNYREEGPD